MIEFVDFAIQNLEDAARMVEDKPEYKESLGRIVDMLVQLETDYINEFPEEQ